MGEGRAVGVAWKAGEQLSFCFPVAVKSGKNPSIHRDMN
jgi:hypothetical protein